MDFEEIKRTITNLSRYDLVVTTFSTGLSGDSESPQVVFDHSSYPGVEAHLFTIADAASWHPEITDTSDVVLFGSKNDSDRRRSWVHLLSILQDVMSRLEQYRQGLKHGVIPSSHWIYHEFRWYRQNWEHRPREMNSVDSFLYSVDESIQYHIKELNNLGYPTTQSCSGLPEDHIDREPYLPYVMFDERIYPRSSAHLFTLADITGWIPSYGPHNFDIELKLTNSKDADRFWNNLVENARELALLLQEYRSQFTKSSDSLKGMA